MVDPRLPCEQCVVCQDGKDYCCPRQGGIGYSRSGGLSERVAVPAKNLCLLPPAVPLQYAALLEPIAVAVHAVRKTGITDFRKEQILVLGAGPVGFALIIVLRAHHPKTILVSEPTSTRRAQVSELVDLTFDPSQDSVVQRSKETTEGRGVDIVFDCAGTPAGLSDGLDALKCEGMYMNLAMYEKPVGRVLEKPCNDWPLTTSQMTLPVLPALMKHVTIKFAAVYSRAEMEEAIRLLAQGEPSSNSRIETLGIMSSRVFTGQLHGYENMVTYRITIDDVVDQGFRRLLKNKDDDIKILVTPKSQRVHDKEL